MRQETQVHILQHQGVTEGGGGGAGAGEGRAPETHRRARGIEAAPQSLGNRHVGAEDLTEAAKESERKAKESQL